MQLTKESILGAEVLISFRLFSNSQRKKTHYSAHLTCGVESVHFTLTFKTSWDFAHTSKPSKWKIIPQFLCRVCIDVTVATATIQPRHHDSLPPLTIYKPILPPFPLHFCFKVQHENRWTLMISLKQTAIVQLVNSLLNFWQISNDNPPLRRQMINTLI